MRLGTWVGDAARRKPATLPPRLASTRNGSRRTVAAPGNAGPTCAPRLTSVIAANGQLSEGWPSNGQIHRRVATYARSLQSPHPPGLASVPISVS